MSKQRNWQLKMMKLSRCPQCGGKNDSEGVLCSKCALKARTRSKKKRHNKPWRPGGPGRPPIDQTPQP